MHYPVAKEGTYRSEACTFDNVQPGSIKFRPSSASAVKASVERREGFAARRLYARTTSTRLPQTTPVYVLWYEREYFRVWGSIYLDPALLQSRVIIAAKIDTEIIIFLLSSHFHNALWIIEITFMSFLIKKITIINIRIFQFK